eukprot:gene28310-34182_t
MVIYAAIEGGGTSWVAALINDAFETLDEKHFETTSPEETLSAISEWLSTKSYDAIGVASFGPVDIRKNSPKYGFITTTPKPGWQQTDVLSLLGVRNGSKPFEFDTDVNAPAMSEYLMGQGQFSSCAYITIGTGVGVGVVINGVSVKGLLHPEGGHIPVVRHPNDIYNCSCSFHTHCLEGYCNNISIAQRLHMDRHQLADIPDDHEVWDFAAYYIAQLCVNLVLILSIERVFIGGGIMNRSGLLDKVRSQTVQLLNGYIDVPQITTADGIRQLIQQPTWGGKAGIIGAAYLAQHAYAQSTSTGK